MKNWKELYYEKFSKGGFGASDIFQEIEAFISSLLSKQKKEVLEEGCNHDFKYSHIEYPATGTYSSIPQNKEVVVCRKCGEIRKVNQIFNY